MCTLLDLHLRPDMQAPLCFVYRTQHHIDPPILLTHVTVRACLTDCTSAFMNCLSHLIVSFLVFFPSMILPPRGNLFFYVPLAPSLQLPTLDGQTIALPVGSGQITVAYSMALGCADCVPGAKTLARLQPDYAGRSVQFIAIASDPCATAEGLQPFLQAVGKTH